MHVPVLFGAMQVYGHHRDFNEDAICKVTY